MQHFLYSILHVVSGDADFAMSITIGRFTQPAVARSIIEAPMGIFTSFSLPIQYASFSSLSEIERTFVDKLS